MSIEGCIAEANRAGFEISNLFQLGEDFWRCSLHSAKTQLFSCFGQGASAEEALKNALAKVLGGSAIEKDLSDFFV